MAKQPLTTRQQRRQELRRAVDGTRAAVLVYACAWVDGHESNQALREVIEQYREAVVRYEHG